MYQVFGDLFNFTQNLLSRTTTLTVAGEKYHVRNILLLYSHVVRLEKMGMHI